MSVHRKPLPKIGKAVIYYCDCYYSFTHVVDKSKVIKVVNCTKEECS